MCDSLTIPNRGSVERAKVTVLWRAAWHSRTEAWDKERPVVLLHCSSHVQLSSSPRVMCTPVEIATVHSAQYKTKNVLSHIKLGNQARPGRLAWPDRPLRISASGEAGCAQGAAISAGRGHVSRPGNGAGGTQWKGKGERVWERRESSLSDAPRVI